MAISRRQLLTAAAGSTALTAGFSFPAPAQGSSIKLGSILDNSGLLDIYGKPMVMATAMAVEEINDAGGLLGRKVELKQYDSQSDIALYTKYAQQLVRDDKVDVVHAGITSASREAIRQTFRRANTLYFYNVLYEGGVCDRNCVITGTTPAQAVEPIIDYAMKKWGNRSIRLQRTTITGRSPQNGLPTTPKSARGRWSKRTSFRLTLRILVRPLPRSRTQRRTLSFRRWSEDRIWRSTGSGPRPA